MPTYLGDAYGSSIKSPGEWIKEGGGVLTDDLVMRIQLETLQYAVCLAEEISDHYMMKGTGSDNWSEGLLDVMHGASLVGRRLREAYAITAGLLPEEP